MFKQGITISAIWLRTVGNQIQVLAEIDNEWRLVIQESDVDCQGKLCPISHIIETPALTASKIDTASYPPVKGR